jgi:hypothetical protein
MTDEPSTHPTEPAEPSAVDPLDERLSAALDDEAAPGHPDTDTAVDAGPVDDRRRALAEARDLLAVPPPRLDDITRRRIVRNAIAERPQAKTRDLTRLNRVGAAAAVLAVVVAGGLAINSIGSSSNDRASMTASDKAASGTTSAPEAAPFALRDVSDPEVLKERVAAALDANDNGAPTAGSETTTSRSNANTDSGAAARCLTTITVSKDATAPRLLADATFKGTPALVAIATNKSGTAVYVLAKNDCRLLTYQFLKE